MQHNINIIATCLLLATCALSLVHGGAVSNEASVAGNLANSNNNNNNNFDADYLRVISNEDQASMQQIKRQLEDDFANFKSVNEVHTFLDKIKLLVQKHPKNTAFAQGDLKELHRFLSQEVITKLIRVDTEPFIMPISDDRMPLAQRAIDDDELTRKLFSGPLRSLIEAKRQQVPNGHNENHRDGNFFSNFWCKISGSCPN